MNLSLKTLGIIVLTSAAIGAAGYAKFLKPAPPPVAQIAAEEKSSEESTITTTEAVKCPGGEVVSRVIVEKKKKDVEKKEVAIVPVIPDPKLLFGYSFNAKIKPLEFTHSVIVGKKIFEGQIKDLYGIVGADVDNKLQVQSARAGLIKLF